MTPIDFGQVFEALPSPYMLLDRDLRYVAANPAYLAATSRTMDELRDHHIFELFPDPGESGKRLMASFRKVLDTGESDTLAFIHYAIPRPEAKGGGFDDRYWTAVHTPICDATGQVAFLLQNTVDVTDIVRMREAASLPYRSVPAEASLIERTREVEDAHRALMADSADFRRLFQQAPGFFAVLSGSDHVFTFASDAYLRLTGNRPLLGLTVREAIPEVVDQGFIDLLDTVYGEGKPYSASGARIMLVGEAGAPPRETYLDFSYDPIRDSDGTVTGIFVQGMDRTESFRALQRQQLMVDELNHRVKNALAMVLSIAAQTLKTNTDIDAARAAFEQRIVALARAHSTLSERQWQSTELKALAEQELLAYGPERASVDGELTVLNPKSTIALAMLLHELTSNAAKYGALSVPEGRVSVAWMRTPDRGLVLNWQERGGPQVAPPTRRGFGSRMMQRVVAGELGGELELDFAPAGVLATLKVPAEAFQRRSHAFVE